MITRNHQHRLIVSMFVGDIEDAITIKRCLSMQKSGCELTVFGFLRDRYQQNIKAGWRTILLGSIKDRHYLLRIVRLIQALIIIVNNKKYLFATNRLYARNLDMAVLALIVRFMFRLSVPLTYEVLDIAKVLQRKTLLGAIVRYLERRVLRSCDELLVSSPAFIEGYFKPFQHFSGRWALVENKISMSQIKGIQRPSHESKLKGRTTGPWRIGWFGTLRSEKSLKLLAEAANALNGAISVDLWGIFKAIPKNDAEKIITSSPFIHYHGRYSMTDLSFLYGQVHFIWCGDIGMINPFNDRLLRPNRLYEAGYFGVPQIGVLGTETASCIRSIGLGWVLPDATVESLVNFFKKITEMKFFNKVDDILSLPTDLFVESDQMSEIVNNW